MKANKKQATSQTFIGPGGRILKPVDTPKQEPVLTPEEQLNNSLLGLVRANLSLMTRPVLEDRYMKYYTKTIEQKRLINYVKDFFTKVPQAESLFENYLNTLK